MASTRAVRAATRATRTAASSRSVRSAWSPGCGGVRSMLAPAIRVAAARPTPAPGRRGGQRLAAVLVADRTAPASGPALAMLLGAGRGQLEPAGGTGRDPDAAQQ